MLDWIFIISGIFTTVVVSSLPVSKTVYLVLFIEFHLSSYVLAVCTYVFLRHNTLIASIRRFSFLPTVDVTHPTYDSGPGLLLLSLGNKIFHASRTPTVCVASNWDTICFLSISLQATIYSLLLGNKNIQKYKWKWKNTFNSIGARRE